MPAPAPWASTKHALDSGAHCQRPETLIASVTSIGTGSGTEGATRLVCPASSRMRAHMTAPMAIFRRVSGLRWRIAAAKGCALVSILGVSMAVIQPAEWHWAAIHGHKIYYAMQGSGSTLVLLHGGGDSGGPSFARQLDVFSERHRIVAPDQVGQGHTPDVPGPLTYTGMMDDTAALLQHLNLNHVDVVGFSDGGIIALMLAVRHPELVRRLVISGVNIAPEGLNADDLDELRATQIPKPRPIDEKLSHLWLTSPTEA